MLLHFVTVVTLAFFPNTLAAPTKLPTAADFIAFNERILTAQGNTAHATAGQVHRRAERWSASHPGLQAQIDDAVAATATKPHYFWSGRYLPARSEADTVMHSAQTIAEARHGTTLELTVGHVPLPPFLGTDPDRSDIWQYASDAYAAASKGDAYFVKGESLRAGNVWDVFEYPRLKRSPEVKRILQIAVHKKMSELPVQIYPDVKGCDGVAFLTAVNCPAGAKLYYGSVNKPVVTAETRAAVDGVVRVAASGNAKGIVRECTEVISSEFINDVFKASGVCEAATAKGNGGKVMNQVLQLIHSTKNRNYVSRRGLLKVKPRVLGTPVIASLTSTVVDSLVAIDYYQKTRPDTAAMVAQIDSLVQTATGKSPGLTAAWAKEISRLQSTKNSLLVELQKQVKEKKSHTAPKPTKNSKPPPKKPTAPVTRPTTTSKKPRPTSKPRKPPIRPVRAPTGKGRPRQG
ncbi:hypothetical protein EXIGLDRAFT_831464 [Exidia glandulosa HHB12029]|uniref:Uncharacterized protein n=1 Tax=Exidia glandulosa HHB12029 TaxID=1314781 RepID=A0A165MNI2_EXIGL|nr:hypothetical protein EXIGLDRAFT_831464 [Exidia glandulosa HHB12029]